VLPDGRLGSGSDDNTIRLWDLTSGAEAARLEADAPFVCLTDCQAITSSPGVPVVRRTPQPNAFGEFL
jgi:WD40 repeat protein